MTRLALRLLVLALVVAAAALAAGVARADSGTTAVEAQASDPCKVLALSVGAVDVDAAGLVIVHVDPVGANVQLDGLLGTLLCPLLGGGATPPVPA